MFLKCKCIALSLQALISVVTNHQIRTSVKKYQLTDDDSSWQFIRDLQKCGDNCMWGWIWAGWIPGGMSGRLLIQKCWRKVESSSLPPLSPVRPSLATHRSPPNKVQRCHQHNNFKSNTKFLARFSNASWALLSLLDSASTSQTRYFEALELNWSLSW